MNPPPPKKKKRDGSRGHSDAKSKAHFEYNRSPDIYGKVFATSGITLILS